MGHASTVSSQPRPLGPGVHQTAFRPRLRLTIPEGWTGEEYDDAMVVFIEGAELAYDATAGNPTTAAELVAVLRGTPDLDAGHIRPTNVGGLTGFTFDGTATEDITYDDNSGKSADQGDRVRAFALDHPARAVAVFLTAPAAQFDALLSQAAPMLDSIVFP